VLVSLSHDPKLEIPLLAAALRLDLAFVGSMASRRTAERCGNALSAAGVPVTTCPAQ
jgi:xanthine dehydrogenase accessory factor